MRRIDRSRAVLVGIAAAALSCQNYDFKHISAVPVTVIHFPVSIAAKLGTPYLLIVQDVSGSMCEPIQADAGVADGGFGAGDCAANPASTKISLVSKNMVDVLSSLHPEQDTFFLGLSAFPDRVDGSDAGSCDAPPHAIFPFDNALNTIPLVTNWYSTAPSIIGGGTPTAKTLLNAGNDFAGADPKARKFVILITDGLPNCNALHPCVSGTTLPLWSDGKDHGCESPNYEHYKPGGDPTAEPPAGCVCSNGGCPDPGGVGAGLSCCESDRYLLTPGQDDLQIKFASWQCLDDVATANAAATLFSQGIQTFVVGMGFDYTDPAVLDRIAQAGAGGQADAGHYQADSEAELVAALQSIIFSAVSSCTYTLDQPVADPRLVEVQITTTTDGGVETQTLVYNDPNGWTFTPPSTIDLQGMSCNVTLKDGLPHTLTITAIAQP